MGCQTWNYSIGYNLGFVSCLDTWDNLRWVMYFCVVICKNGFIYLNHLVLRILHVPIIFVISIRLFTGWNKCQGLGTWSSVYTSSTYGFLLMSIWNLLVLQASWIWYSRAFKRWWHYHWELFFPNTQINFAFIIYFLYEELRWFTLFLRIQVTQENNTITLTKIRCFISFLEIWLWWCQTCCYIAGLSCLSMFELLLIILPYTRTCKAFSNILY